MNNLENMYAAVDAVIDHAVFSLETVPYELMDALESRDRTVISVVLGHVNMLSSSMNSVSPALVAAVSGLALSETRTKALSYLKDVKAAI